MATAGQYLGSYRLLTQVGAGRGTQVWEAINDARNQRSAVKFLLATHAQNADMLRAMKHEFSVGQSLNHPQVIRMYDFDPNAKFPYLGMEFFGPSDVKQAIQQGLDRIAPLIPKVILEAAEGLAYFHQQGWIHRDIKPNNYLINDKGDVKLIDFALAERRKGFIGRLLHRQATVQGTRSYISPEQIRRKALDARTDIYSYGCMVHELIAGKPPFTGSTETELLNKHLKAAPPPLESINRNVTADFSLVVRQMLAKEPGERPESMNEVIHWIRNNKIFRAPPKARQPSPAAGDT